MTEVPVGSSIVPAGSSIMAWFPVTVFPVDGVPVAGTLTVGEAVRSNNLLTFRLNLSRRRSLRGVPATDPAMVEFIISISIKKISQPHPREIRTR